MEKIFFCRYKGERRQREELRLNMAVTLNQAMKRGVGRAREEHPRKVPGAKRPRDKRAKKNWCSQMAGLYREEQLGEGQPSPVTGLEKFRVESGVC